MILVALRYPLACALEGLLDQVGSVFGVSVLGLVIVVHQVLELHVAFRVVEFALSLKQNLKRLSLSSSRLGIDKRITVLIFLV